MVVCEKVARIWEWCVIDKIDKFQDQTTHGGFLLYNKKLNSKLKMCSYHFRQLRQVLL